MSWNFGGSKASSDPWHGMRERDVVGSNRGGISGAGAGGSVRNSVSLASNRGFSSDSGFGGGGLRQVASTGGWNWGGASMGGGSDPWAGLRSTNRPPTPVTYDRYPGRYMRDMAPIRNAIAGIESAGWGAQDYQAIGPKHPTLGNALGRYQIMEGNLPRWSRQAVGRTVGREEFLRSPDLQNKIFDHKFGGYINRFGSPELAAQAWFGGPGSVGKLNRKDVLGTTVGAYAKKFSRNLGKEAAGTENSVAGLSPRGRGGGMDASSEMMASSGAGVSATSTRDIGMPGVMAGLDVGGFGRAAGMPRGLRQGNVDAGMQGLNVPPAGSMASAGAGVASGGVLDMSDVDMGSPAANAGLRAGVGAPGAFARANAPMRDVFAGSFVGKTQADEDTLASLINGGSGNEWRDRSDAPFRRLILKNQKYGLL